MSAAATEISSESPDGEDEYVVEKVVAKKIENGKVFYQIKWLGWPDTDNTWEPIENCAKCENLISQFEEALKQRKKGYTSGKISSTDSSASNSPDDSDFDERKPTQKTKKQRKRHQKSKSSNNKNNLLNDSDDETQIRKHKKKSSSNSTKHKGSRGDEKVNNGDRMTLFDPTSFDKIKRPKDIVKETKKSSEKEKEQIRMYLGMGTKSKDKPSNEDTKKSVSSAKGRVESDASLQINSKDRLNRKKENTNNEQKVHSKHYREKGSSNHEKNSALKRVRRISSTSSSEGECYEEGYFGYERGKRLTKILEWFPYETKILHLVKYSDGEEEYLSDTTTLKMWPDKVNEMYARHVVQNGLSIPDELKDVLNFGLQNVSLTEKTPEKTANGTANEIDMDVAQLTSMESFGENLKSVCPSSNLNSTFTSRNDGGCQRINFSDDQQVNKNHSKGSNDPSFVSSIIAIDSTVEPTSSVDSVFVVHNDSSLSQNFSQSQIDPEFEVEVEESGNEGSPNSSGSTKEMLGDQLDFDDNKKRIQDSDPRKIGYDEEEVCLFDLSPSSRALETLSDDNSDDILFSPSPPSSPFQ